MNRFDRILWRINGVLFLLLLSLGMFPLISSFIQPFHSRPWRGNEAAIVNETRDTHEKEFLHLGTLSRVTGTSIVRMPLQSESSSRGSSFKISSYGGHTRNFLFVDHSDLSSWWLFEGFDRLILKEHDLRAEAGRNDKRVISTIFEVVTADTDGDHRPTETDRVSAFFTGADGKKPFEIVSPSDRILSVDQVSDNEVLIIYQRGSAVTSALFSAHDGAKVKESALPMQNNK